MTEQPTLRRVLEEVKNGYEADEGSDFDWPAWYDRAVSALAADDERMENERLLALADDAVWHGDRTAMDQLISALAERKLMGETA